VGTYQKVWNEFYVQTLKNAVYHMIATFAFSLKTQEINENGKISSGVKLSINYSSFLNFSFYFQFKKTLYDFYLQGVSQVH